MEPGKKYMDFMAKLQAGKKIVDEIILDELREEYIEKIISSLEEQEQTQLKNFSNTEEKEKTYFELLKFLYKLGKK
jgi:hypothetical protein